MSEGLRVYNPKPISQIKAERDEQIREALEEQSLDLYLAVAGLFESYLEQAAQIATLEAEVKKLKGAN